MKQLVFGLTLIAATALMAQTDIAAYVWPAYQPEPRWAELGIFKAGKGEWQNVWEAVPKWEGHEQPRKPLWGYENEADPKVMEKKIDAAVSHGVNVFIYDWYWYGGRPFLEDALDKGFLCAKNNAKMKFFVMWANHHVNWLWDNTTADKRWGAPRKDWLGFVTDEEFRTKLVPRWISQYFGRPNYYRIGGKPVLMIYEVGTFVQGVGGVEKAAAAIAYLRAEAVKAGLGGVHLMACDFGLRPEWVKALGVDSGTIYNLVHWSSPSGNPDYDAFDRLRAVRFIEHMARGSNWTAMALHGGGNQEASTVMARSFTDWKHLQNIVKAATGITTDPEERAAIINSIGQRKGRACTYLDLPKAD